MEQVTKEQFYAEIREKGLDLVYTPIGDYPYYGEFKFRNGALWGVVKPTEIDPARYSYPWYEERYFINR